MPVGVKRGPYSKSTGFATFSPAKRKWVASRGGKIAHQLGVAHRWTSEEARAASKRRRRPADHGGTMTDKLVEALKRLEAHAEALMRVPPDADHIQNLQAIMSIAVLDIKRTIEALHAEPPGAAAG